MWRWAKWGWLALTFAPPIALVVAASRYYLPYPWVEAWVWMPPLMDAWFSGSWTWGDFLIVQNGYLLLVPAVSMAWLASLTGWSQSAEVALNLAGAWALFAGAVAAAALCLPAGKRKAALYFAPIASFFCFSLNQSCNWFYAGQWITILAVVFAVWALIVGAAVRQSLTACAAACLLGTGATWSFGSGALVWPALFFAFAYGWLLGVRRGDWREWATCVVAASVSVGVWRLLAGTGGGFAGEATAIERLAQAIRFMPVYLGAGIWAFAEKSAWLAGLAALLFGALLHAALAWVRPQALRAAFPFTVLMVFSLLLGFSAGYARGEGHAPLVERVYGSLFEGAFLRYPLFSQWYWLGLCWFLWRAAANGQGWLRWPAASALATILVAAVLSARTGYYEAEERYHLYTPLVKRLVTEDLGALPTRLQWPYGNEARTAIGIMKKHRISIYRPDVRPFWERTNARSNWE